MSKRIKPVLNLHVIKDLVGADSTLAEIAELNRHIDVIEAGMNEQIDQLKLHAENDCQPYKQRREELEQALMHFAKENKENLFGKAKTQRLTFGNLGFRQSTTLMPKAKGGFARVLEVLQEHELDQYIRTKQEVDKEALHGASEKTMVLVGVRLQVSNTFFYEINEQELDGNTAA